MVLVRVLPYDSSLPGQNGDMEMVLLQTQDGVFHEDPFNAQYFVTCGWSNQSFRILVHFHCHPLVNDEQILGLGLYIVNYNFGAEPIIKKNVTVPCFKRQFNGK
jgi:hypothetical protein